MNRYRAHFLPWCLAVGVLLLMSSLVQANEERDADYFYEKLSPYGTWVDHPQYHRVWYPRDVPAGWRPYTHGHWVHTQLHGWMWQSDWEWGWAPFHYGRWLLDDQYGWVWVPGSVWGPAWVAWRSGGNYIGWAPLPPAVGWDDNRGLMLDHFDLNSSIAASHWVFIEERNFLVPRIHQHIFRPPNNFVYIRDTQNITHFTVVNRHVVNHCLPIGHIEHVTHQPVRSVPIREVNHFTEAHHGHHDDNAVFVFRPRIHAPRQPEQPIKSGTTTRRPVQPHNEIKEHHPANIINGSQPSAEQPQRTENRNTPRFQEQPIKPTTPPRRPARPRNEIKEYYQSNDTNRERTPAAHPPRSDTGGTPPLQQAPPIKPVVPQTHPAQSQHDANEQHQPNAVNANPRTPAHERQTADDKKAVQQQQKAERKAKKQQEHVQREQAHREKRELKEHKPKPKQDHD